MLSLQNNANPNIIPEVRYAFTKWQNKSEGRLIFYSQDIYGNFWFTIVKSSALPKANKTTVDSLVTIQQSQLNF